MSINNISFKNGYKETACYIGQPNPRVTEALVNARPYLR